MNSKQDYPKIPWKVLRDSFRGEWVELVDYEWDWAMPNPKWARVGFHAPERMELMNLLGDERSRESLILFLGAPECLIETA